MFAEANSVDPDQTPQNAASNQGLYCLQFVYTATDILIAKCT